MALIYQGGTGVSVVLFVQISLGMIRRHWLKIYLLPS